MRRASPLTLVRLDRFGVMSARRRDGRLERVGFAREIASAFVVNLSGQAGRGLDGVGFGELNVRGSPNDALDAELSC